MKKVQANIHLVDTQEVNHLQSFNQSFSLLYKALWLIVPVLVIPVIDIVIAVTLSLCVKSRTKLLQAHPEQGFVQI